MSQILVELIKLASLIITLNKASASASRIAAVLDTPSDIEFSVKNESDDEDLAVHFDGVSFSYDRSGDGEDVLKDISFKVKAGETVGIIGGTGSGKSTLANLIPGFYHATEGEVFVFGKNASLLSSSELEEIFGVVPQKANLFAGTIRSNLKWGNPDATDEQLLKALELASAKDFVLAKEGGLDEPVLQGGKNFSGGQRQRLTVARALVRQPKILILDDSASALDYATESTLRRNIANLDYDPTVFIVSQRASSIMHADLIIVLDDGEPVGIGKHEELLETCEIYREIYETQFSTGGDRK
jgi:ABC-type multidrug transport system fused ATPase/permease subunit